MRITIETHAGKDEATMKIIGREDILRLIDVTAEALVSESAEAVMEDTHEETATHSIIQEVGEQVWQLTKIRTSGALLVQGPIVAVQGLLGCILAFEEEDAWDELLEEMNGAQ